MKLPLSLLPVLLLLAACTSGPTTDTPTSSPTTEINSLGATPNPTPSNVGTVFSWTVFGQNLVCKLDVEGNGTIDYTVNDCSSHSRVIHTYGLQGAFNAKLTVSGADGKTLQQTTPVTVSAPNNPPTISSLIPSTSPSSNDPLEVSFAWTVNDIDSDITQCQFDAESDGVWEFDGLCSGLPAISSVDKSSATTFTLRHKYRSKGRYNATLVARDPYVSSQNSVAVRVPWNRVPVINSFKATPTSSSTASIEFGVSDPDGDPLTCVLEVQSIGSFTYKNCGSFTRNFNFSKSGTYKINLKVSDPHTQVLKSTTATLESSTTTGPANFQQVAAGGGYTCALTSQGEAYCWGSSSQGQNGTAARTYVPVKVTSVGTPYTQIAVGSEVTCALNTSGKIYCWGSDQYGQLGDGPTSHAGNISTTPIAVTMPSGNGFSKFTQVTVGKRHVCALGNNKQAYCWGYNYYGQLGIGTNGNGTNADLPTAVTGGKLFKQIVSGHSANSTCAIQYEPPTFISSFYQPAIPSNDGRLYCWGSNEYGQLGINTLVDSNAPTEVVGDGTFTGHKYQQVSVSSALACALDLSNDVYCWGQSSSYDPTFNPDEGQDLGNGSLPSTFTYASKKPVKLLHTPSAGTFGNYTSVSVGDLHMCLSDEDGVYYCRGNYAETSGELGIGDSSVYTGPDNVLVPLPVILPTDPGFTRFVQLSSGTYHTCALGDNQRVYCWGNASNGEVGYIDNDDPDDAYVPTMVVTPIVTASQAITR